MAEDMSIEGQPIKPIIIEGKPGHAQSVAGRRTYERVMSLKATEAEVLAQDTESYRQLLSANGVAQEDITRHVSRLSEVRGMLSNAINQTRSAFSHEQPQPQPQPIEVNGKR